MDRIPRSLWIGLGDRFASECALAERVCPEGLQLRLPLAGRPRPRGVAALGVYAATLAAFVLGGVGIESAMLIAMCLAAGAVVFGYGGLWVRRIRMGWTRWQMPPWTTREWFLLFPTSGLLGLGFALIVRGVPTSVLMGWGVYGIATAVMLWEVLIMAPMVEPAEGKRE